MSYWRLLTVIFACGTGLGATAAEFFQAIRSGDSAVIRAIAKDKANLALADEKGTTPFQYAAAIGNLEGFRIVLNAGANVNAKDDNEATPLHWAACDPDRVRLLLEHGADVNAKTKLGRTPLLVATSCAAAYESVKMLIAKGADVNAAEPQIGTTPLINASNFGGPRIVNLLLDAGAKPDVADKSDTTPLQNAVGFNDVKLVRRLLHAGAKVNSKNTFAGKVRNGDIALKQLTPLMNAAPFGTPEMIQVLLDAGADVKLRDMRGMTPLMMSVASDNQDARVVKLLIERGSDVNAKAENGETVMDWARKFNEPAVVSLLEKAGAKASAMEPAPKRKSAPLDDPKAAAALSLKLVESSVQTFFKKSGCVGCHHQPMATMALRAARAGGIATDAKVEEEQYKSISTLTLNPARLLLMQAGGGGLDNVANNILGMGEEKLKPGMVSDSAAALVAARQKADGSWFESRTTSRAPMQESDITVAANCIRVMRLYTIPARSEEFAGRIAKARSWLEAEKPQQVYEQADRLLGLYWGGAVPAKVREAAIALLKEQRADGGWAQRKHLESDAYATGLVLRALRLSGQLQPSDASYRSAVSYLLRTQMEDGSWYVRSRAMKLQPYFQSGFPYDHDQWISYTATAYAVTALAAAERPAVALK